MNDDNLDPSIVIEPGIYRHYKGKHYEVIATGRHSETLEEMVVYKTVAANVRVWVRPAEMFFEEINGVPRFARAED